jgi:hypothetical protein
LARASRGGKIVEIPITFVERVHGESKMSSWIVFEALWLVTKWGFCQSAEARTLEFSLSAISACSNFFKALGENDFELFAGSAL